MDPAEVKLGKLGYRQQFARDFTLFSNFSVSFSVLSVVTGVTAAFGLAWNNGGPVSAVWGWIIVTFATSFVGLSMAEIVSAVPCSGGPYSWAGVLGGRHAPFWSFLTGWFNLLGQVSLTSSITFAMANHIQCMIFLSSEGAGDIPLRLMLAIYAGVLIGAALLNIFSTKVVAFLNVFSLIWHVGGIAVLVTFLPAIAPTHRPASFVFWQFNDVLSSTSGIKNNGYLFLIGTLMSQYTITGYDASAHMAEETRGADFSAPLAILLAIGASAVAGWIYVLALLFSIQDPDALMTGRAGGYASGQIFYDVFQARFGRGEGAVVLMSIPAVAMFLCTMSSITANSRMVFGFARDNGVPLPLLARISRHTGTPMWAIAFSVAGAFLMGLPLLRSTVAFSAVVSVSTIGTYISYAIPICCRLVYARRTFERGPFHLGRFSLAIGWVAVVWVAFISAVFVLPTNYPVTSGTLNYAGVTVGIVLVCVLIWWWLPCVGARHWYTGAKFASRGLGRRRGPPRSARRLQMALFHPAKPHLATIPENSLDPVQAHDQLLPSHHPAHVPSTRESKAHFSIEGAPPYVAPRVLEGDAEAGGVDF